MALGSADRGTGSFIAAPLSQRETTIIDLVNGETLSDDADLAALGEGGSA
jgi:hypothetical protein